MIGKQKTDNFELHQLLDLMNIAQDLVKNIEVIQCCTAVCRVNKFKANG